MKSHLLAFSALALAACTGAGAEPPAPGPALASDPALAPASTATADTRDFTCPMHSDVHHVGPGACPKCGMTLVPAVIADSTHETSAGYAIGVKKIVDDRAQLQTLLDSGKLADLHKVAEGLAKTAKALPSTCDSLGDTQKADVAAQAQKLQDLFKPLDAAGDGGDKDKAATALKDYDAPIAALQAYLP